MVLIRRKMPKIVDITGKIFGYLTVIKLDHRRQRPGHNESWWLCKCDCGKEKLIERRALVSGSTKSCGCHKCDLLRAKKKYTPTTRKIKQVWDSMIYRCTNPNSRVYSKYGGRGITVCSEWLSFTSFMDWSLRNGYAPRLTIERIDNDKGCSPDNCKWATYKEQENNKSSNHIVTYLGEAHTVMWWSEHTGINFSTLRQRISDRNWSVERSLLTPPCKRSIVEIPYGYIINHKTGDLLKLENEVKGTC